MSILKSLRCFAALSIGFAGLLLMSQSIALAQESRATLTGTVKDASGAVIPQANVVLENTAAGTAHPAVSNQEGRFSIPFVQPGTYRVTVKMTGFKQFVRQRIDLRIGETVDLPIVLEVGEMTEAIEVRAQDTQLDTATASLSRVIDRAQLQDLPIRDGSSAELVLLSPGVVNATDLRQRKAAFTNGLSQTAIQGGGTYGAEFTIDGIPNTAAQPGQQRIAFSPPTEALQEQNVATSTYDASQGHNAGAVINMVTRAGTNELHGEAHWWFRNKSLDANSFYNNRRGVAKDNYRDNRVGFTIGGPVYLPKLYNGKNKTFWFFAFETNPSTQPIYRTTTVPTEAQKKGDFSSLLAISGQYQLYDPFSTVQSGSVYTRSPFPGNIIPEARVNANTTAQNLLKYYPQGGAAKGTDLAIREGRNNWDTTAPLAENKYRTYTGRLDHTFSDTHRIFGRFSLDRWDEIKDRWFGADNPAARTMQQTRSRVIGLDDVYMISPSMVLNVRGGLTRKINPMIPAGQGVVDYSALGFSDSVARLIPEGQGGFPLIDLADFSDTNPGGFQQLAMEVWSVGGSISWMKGKHNLRFGADHRTYRQNYRNSIRDVSPQLTFNSTYTRAASNSAAPLMGGDLAAFLLGVPSSGSMSLTNGYAAQNTWQGFFLQDDWKATSRLTLNFGIRYELDNPETERYDRFVNGFDPSAPLNITQAAQVAYAANPIPEVAAANFRVLGGILYADPGNRGLWKRDNKNIMPRFGFAYQLNSRTTLRGGYGIFFDQMGITEVGLNQTGFSQSTPLTSTLDFGQTYIASLFNPFPNGLAQPAGNRNGVNQDVGLAISSVGYLAGNTRNPYNQTWSFGIQRELPGKFVLDTSYVGNRAVGLRVNRDINAVPRQYLSPTERRDQPVIDYLTGSVTNPFAGLLPGTGLTGASVQRQQLLLPFPQFSSITGTVNSGYAWYHALQARIERRMSNGLTFNLGYTFSRAMEAVNYLNKTDTRPEEVISGSDARHNLSFSGLYQLPFGKGRKYGSSWTGVVNHLAGGWQLGTLFKLQTGFPVSTGVLILKPGYELLDAKRDNPTWDAWYSLEPFSNVSAEYPTGENIRAFSSRWNQLRGPGYWLLDLSLNKQFALTDRFAMQFRGEAFNVPNHSNFYQWPNLNPLNAASVQAATNNGYPRNIQLALKLMF